MTQNRLCTYTSGSKIAIDIEIRQCFEKSDYGSLLSIATLVHIWFSYCSPVNRTQAKQHHRLGYESMREGIN